MNNADTTTVGVSYKIQPYKYRSVDINPPLNTFSSYKTRESASPNPLCPLEIRLHWKIFYTVSNRSMHNSPVPNLLSVLFISAWYPFIHHKEVPGQIHRGQQPLWTALSGYDDQSLVYLWKYTCKWRLV